MFRFSDQADSCLSTQPRMSGGHIEVILAGSENNMRRSSCAIAQSIGTFVFHIKNLFFLILRLVKDTQSHFIHCKQLIGRAIHISN